MESFQELFRIIFRTIFFCTIEPGDEAEAYLELCQTSKTENSLTDKFDRVRNTPLQRDKISQHFLFSLNCCQFTHFKPVFNFVLAHCIHIYEHRCKEELKQNISWKRIISWNMFCCLFQVVLSICGVSKLSLILFIVTQI